MTKPIIVVLWLLLVIVVVDALRRNDLAPIAFGVVGAALIGTVIWAVRWR